MHILSHLREVLMLSRYAREIAVSTANIIGYDVILTDVQGMIIAASDPCRDLGTLHEASLWVLSSGEGRGFDQKEVENLRGTLPGVTYPIEDTSGKMVGTIGISGDPEKVTPFALIVRKQAEMFLKEKELIETAFDRERIINRLVLELTEPPMSEKEEELLIARARGLGFDPQKGHVSLVFTMRDRSQGRESSFFRTVPEREIHHEIRKVFGNFNDLSAAMGGNIFAVFHSLSTITGEGRLNIRAACMKVIRALEDYGIEGVAAGIGSHGKGLIHSGRSYREARLAASLGPRVNVDGSVHFIEDLRIEEILYSSEERLLEELIHRHLGTLRANPDWTETRNTFLQWCHSGFSIQKAAASLHIHRNTFTYRLEKLQERSGKDLRDFRQVMEVYLAINAERMLQDHRDR